MMKNWMISLAVITSYAMSSQGQTNDLLIPIGGRTAGANGTFWNTDLTLANLSGEYEALPVTLMFVVDGVETTSTVTIRAFESVTISDFAGLAGSGVGFIRVTAPVPDAQIVARAEIYNRHSEGRFGQTVNAFPSSAAAREWFLTGLTTGDGRRSNFGVTNPTGRDATIQVVTRDGGDIVDRFEVTLPPRSVRQFNAGARHPGLDLTLQLTSTEPVLVFGSVIAERTGDASFVAGVTRRPTSDFVMTPGCPDAAPLLLSFPRVAPGWIVLFDDAADAAMLTAELATRHSFVPSFVYIGALKGFAAELTPQQVAALRCEDVVVTIEQNLAS